MKLYTQTPNRLGRPLSSELGGLAGPSLVSLMVARMTITEKASHLNRICQVSGVKSKATNLMTVVIIWRYLVLVTLQKTNCPMVQTNTARKIL